MGHPSTPRLLVLHALRLRGVAEADEIAAYMLADEDAVRVELPRLEAEDLIRYRRGRIGGWTHTPEGRATGEQLVAEELDRHGLRPHLEAVYGEFLTFNRQLLEVCTSWQLRTVDGHRVPNDHLDTGHDRAILDALVALDQRVQPVLDALIEDLDRFAGHQRRLRYALDRVLAGEHDWLTRPMFPSYHSCWFELHEDLLATLGRDRTTEGST